MLPVLLLVMISLVMVPRFLDIVTSLMAGDKHQS